MFIDAVLECLGVRWELHCSVLSYSDTLSELYTNSKRQRDVQLQERAGMVPIYSIWLFVHVLFSFFGLVWCALFCFLGLVELKRSLKILKRSKLVNKFCSVHQYIYIYMFAWRINHSNSMLHEYLQVGSVSISNSTNWKSFEHPNNLIKKQHWLN